VSSRAQSVLCNGVAAPSSQVRSPQTLHSLYAGGGLRFSSLCLQELLGVARPHLPPRKPLGPVIWPSLAVSQPTRGGPQGRPQRPVPTPAGCAAVVGRAHGCVAGGRYICHIPQRLSPLLAALQWSGVRGALGVAGGRYYFRIKVLQPLPAPAALAGADSWPAHEARLGLSAPHAPLGLLGEAPGSYGYAGSGFKCAGARWRLPPDCAPLLPKAARHTSKSARGLWLNCGGIRCDSLAHGIINLFALPAATLTSVCQPKRVPQKGGRAASGCAKQILHTSIQCCMQC